MIRAASLVLTIASLAACSKDKGKDKPAPSAPTAAAPADAAAATSSEWFRAVVGTAEGTPIPFYLHIPPGGNEAFIVTGPDRTRAKLVSRPPSLALEFDLYRTKITATAGSDGKLAGAFESASGSWGAAKLSFNAEPVASADPAKRFTVAAGGPDPLGVWKLAFPDQAAKLTLKRGEGPELLGTLSFQTGNIAFMAGAQDGRTIRLSAFDGSSPYLFVGELDEAGKTIKGNWTAGQALAWKEAFDGARTDDFTLELQTQLASKRPKLKLPQIAKAPYAGKPVIVELGGSWCAACGHAAKKLKELKAKHAKDGLEIVMLAYEFTDDPAYNRAQADSFKQKYEIPWEVIPIDGGLDKYAEILPKEVEGIDASGFPITIFVARDGSIEGFHSSFPPESWGEVHQKTVAEYDRLAAAITAKK